MKYILTTIFALFLLIGTINAQVVERSVEAIETLTTGVSFVYRGVDIPVLDLSYHEWSSDSITWSKTYTSGDCYLRISNDVKTTWVGINVCGGSGTGTSQIDTIIVTKDGVSDTITSGTATVTIPTPITITGSTGNTSTDTTHTHELVFHMGELENVDTTAVVDGYVLKWNNATQTWVGAPDLIGGGASGQLTVKEQDGAPSVGNVVEIRVENGRLTNEGAGAVSIDFSLEPIDGKQDFFRTDTLTVSEGDTFVSFDTPLPSTDYVITNAYALYSNGERQSLSYDSLTVNGFRVLGVAGESLVHYLAMWNVDSLGLAVTDQGKVLASASDTNLGYLDSKVDDSTIVVINNQLHAKTVDSVPEQNVYLGSIGQDETLKEYLASVGTPHVESGTTITDLGNDSIAIEAGIVFMKSTNSSSGNLVSVSVAADTLYVPQDTNFLVMVDYNGGNPYYRLQQSIPFYLYSNWDELPFAAVVNLGYRIIENSFEQESLNPMFRSILAQLNSEPVRYQFGLEVADEGTRQFSVGFGAAIFANTSEPIYAINTSTVDTFTRVYYDNGWQRVVGETTINNTHYNDTAQGLVALTSDYYTYKWLYYVKDAPSYWMVLDGQEQTSNYTDASTPTSPLFSPPETNQFYAGALLVGKFIVQEGRTEFIKIQNPFSEAYGVPSRSTQKSYGFTSQGVPSGTYYIGGFYDISSTDANLTQASATQSFAAANLSHASHPFIVSGGAGTVDAGTVGLRVTGTRIEDNGTRTPNYADTIITDITSSVLNDYTEAVKFIGTVQYELIVTSGTPTTYSFDFNYGLAKYDDFGNRDFDVTDFEVVGLAGANDAAFNITLIHHDKDGWTYAATGFTIAVDAIVDLQTIHNTEYQLVNGEYFAFKVVPVGHDDIIAGAESEGVIIRVVTNANNSVQSMDAHIGVRVVE